MSSKRKPNSSENSRKKQKRENIKSHNEQINNILIHDKPVEKDLLVLCPSDVLDPNKISLQEFKLFSNAEDLVRKKARSLFNPEEAEMKIKTQFSSLLKRDFYEYKIFPKMYDLHHFREGLYFTKNFVQEYNSKYNNASQKTELPKATDTRDGDDNNENRTGLVTGDADQDRRAAVLATNTSEKSTQQSITVIDDSQRPESSRTVSQVGDSNADEMVEFNGVMVARRSVVHCSKFRPKYMTLQQFEKNSNVLDLIYQDSERVEEFLTLYRKGQVHASYLKDLYFKKSFLSVYKSYRRTLKASSQSQISGGSLSEDIPKPSGEQHNSAAREEMVPDSFHPPICSTQTLPADRPFQNTQESEISADHSVLSFIAANTPSTRLGTEDENLLEAIFANTQSPPLSSLKLGAFSFTFKQFRTLTKIDDVLSKLLVGILPNQIPQGCFRKLLRSSAAAVFEQLKYSTADEVRKSLSNESFFLYPTDPKLVCHKESRCPSAGNYNVERDPRLELELPLPETEHAENDNERVNNEDIIIDLVSSESEEENRGEKDEAFTKESEKNPSNQIQSEDVLESESQSGLLIINGNPSDREEGTSVDKTSQVNQAVFDHNHIHDVLEQDVIIPEDRTEGTRSEVISTHASISDQNNELFNIKNETESSSYTPTEIFDGAHLLLNAETKLVVNRPKQIFNEIHKSLQRAKKLYGNNFRLNKHIEEEIEKINRILNNALTPEKVRKLMAAEQRQSLPSQESNCASPQKSSDLFPSSGSTFAQSTQSEQMSQLEVASSIPSANLANIEHNNLLGKNIGNIGKKALPEEHSTSMVSRIKKEHDTQYSAYNDDVEQIEMQSETVITINDSPTSIDTLLKDLMPCSEPEDNREMLEEVANQGEKQDQKQTSSTEQSDEAINPLHVDEEPSESLRKTLDNKEGNRASKSTTQTCPSKKLLKRRLFSSEAYESQFETAQEEGSNKKSIRSNLVAPRKTHYFEELQLISRVPGNTPPIAEYSIPIPIPQQQQLQNIDELDYQIDDSLSSQLSEQPTVDDERENEGNSQLQTVSQLLNSEASVFNSTQILAAIDQNVSHQTNKIVEIPPHTNVIERFHKNLNLNDIFEMGHEWLRANYVVDYKLQSSRIEIFKNYVLESFSFVDNNRRLSEYAPALQPTLENALTAVITNTCNQRLQIDEEAFKCLSGLDNKQWESFMRILKFVRNFSYERGDSEISYGNALGPNVLSLFFKTFPNTLRVDMKSINSVKTERTKITSDEMHLAFSDNVIKSFEFENFLHKESTK